MAEVVVDYDESVHRRREIAAPQLCQDLNPAQHHLAELPLLLVVTREVVWLELWLLLSAKERRKSVEVVSFMICLQS